MLQAADEIPPLVQLRAPSFASDRSVTRRFRLGWTGSDRGTGVSRYTLEVSEVGLSANRWRTVAAGTTATRAIFRGIPGDTYRFRIRARDGAGNLSRYVYQQTVVPIDERTRLASRSRGWRRLDRDDAYGGTLLRTRRAGAELRMPFEGQRISLIGRRVPGGNRIAVSVAGRTRIVSLRGRGGHRNVVFRSQELPPGRHVLRVRTLDRGVADVDAFGVRAGPAFRP